MDRATLPKAREEHATLTEAHPERAPLPSPSPELILLAVVLTAFLKATSPSKRRRLVRLVGDLLETSERRSRVVRIRALSFDAEVAQAHAAAVEWWRAVSGAIMAEAEQD